MRVIAVENWDVYEQMLDYTYKRYIQSESQEHPVLMSEPAVSLLCFFLFSLLAYRNCTFLISESICLEFST